MTDGEPSTYGALHAGDLVRGADGQDWGVAEIVHVPVLSVTLVRGTHRVTGYPAAGEPVTVVRRADFSAEIAVGWALVNSLGPVDLLGERWE